MSKQLKQPKTKFQFRIRSLLICVFLVSAAVNIYLWIRPVEIPVPVVMGYDTFESPTSRVTELRTWWAADSLHRSIAQAKAEFEAKYGYSWDEDTEEVTHYQITESDLLPFVKNGYVKTIVDQFAICEVENFLKWLQSNFELQETPTLIDVFKCTQSHWDGCSLHDFQVASILALGIGDIIEPERFGPADDYMFHSICEIAGDKFHVEAHDFDGQHILRLLINGRVYRIYVSNDWSWYDSRNACDILNVILARQKFKERFFVFQREYGKSYDRLVMFGTPNQIKNLVETFEEFEVVKGAEIYWQK